MPEMLIGEWRQATVHEEIELVNPATEEVVDSAPAGAAEDVELLFGGWKSTGSAKEHGSEAFGYYTETKSVVQTQVARQTTSS